MDEAELNELAIKVAARLNSSSVTRLIPRDIQEGLARDAYNYPTKMLYQVPIGPGGFLIEATITPDGEITLRLADMRRAYFWSATLTSNPESQEKI